MRPPPAPRVEPLRTVLQWSFEPARRNGEPVATVALVPVTFRIY